MTLPRAVELQREVFERLFAAMSPVPVSSTPLSVDRYVRVDGVSLDVDATYRNYEAATHRFFIHAFDSPDEGTNSSLWVIEALTQADSAVRLVELPGASRIRMSDMQVSFTPRADGKLDAHAFARYSVSIGEL